MIGLQPVSSAPVSALPSLSVWRAASDIVTAGWSAVPTAPLFAAIAEGLPSDADYVLSPPLAGAAPLILGLSATLPPGSYTIRLRARQTDSPGQARASLLDAADVPQGASAWQALGTAFTTYELPVTTTGTATRIQLEVQA